MKNFFYPSIRIIGQLLKFLAIILYAENATAKVYTEASFALATIILMVYIYGMEYYAVAIRESVLKKDILVLNSRNYSNIIFYFASYCVCSIASFFYLYIYTELSLYQVITIICITIVESITIEISRRLISVGMINKEATINFIKQILWPITIVLLIAIGYIPNLTELVTIILYCNIVGLLIYYINIMRLIIKEDSKLLHLDLYHIRNMIKILPIYIVSGIFTRLIFWIDKSIILGGNINDSAIYLYAFQFSAGISMVVDILVTNKFLYKINSILNTEKFYKKSRKLQIIYGIIVFVIYTFGLISIDIIMNIAKSLGYAKYYDFKIFIIITIALLINSLLTILNYPRYLSGKNDNVLISSIMPFLLFLLFNLTFKNQDIYYIGFYLLFSLLITFILMLFYTTFNVKKYN